MNNLIVSNNQNRIESNKVFSLNLAVIDNMSHGHNISRGISAGTKDQRKIVGRQFNDYLENRDLKIQDINEKVINDFLDSGKLKPSTRNAKRNHIIQLIKAQSNDLRFRVLISETAKNIKTVKIDKSIRNDEYLKIEQINHLIECARKQKTKLLTEVLFQTGCRVDELINIKFSDININGRVKIKIVGKGRKERTVYAKRPEIIDEIKESFNSNEYLFETTSRNRNGKKVKYNRVNIFRIIRKAGEKAGFSIHPHTLRHSCAMHLKFMGKSPQYIQKYLGHSKVNITIEHYFHDKPEDEVMDIF